MRYTLIPYRTKKAPLYGCLQLLFFKFPYCLIKIMHAE